ncbi:hypothetical protein ACFOEZ_07865 [Tianweitania populi]|uniref:Uncharacterized protein n=1 Tax=Tianweitania populi TaxID=1607949 RepID=A0A8J3DNA2_9HYPH|nr:hypothetical protein [Tianweitania populi]GHD11163.1 hypothetical protein GCM10016234_13990 [Tianweitania populi]
MAACVLIGLATPHAHAQDAWLHGQWCDADSGEMMIVEADSFGFNENTVCKWLDKPQAGSRIEARISCVTHHPDGSKDDAWRPVLRIVNTGPRSLSLRFGKGNAVAYAKC